MSGTRDTDLSVTQTEETFTSAGVRCAATVYRPRGVTGPVPVIVMGHGITLTRLDGIPAFARQFAATGCSVVAFDYRHWGDSDGHPRGWFSLGRQQCDWRAAVAFARQLDGTDPDRVGLWGFSMSAGMALKTAAADPRIAAVIAVCPITDGLAAWLEPAPAGTVLRMVSRALREMITRRPVTMPVAGRPGDFAVLPAPEALPGFEHVTAGSFWRNEISTSWLLSLAAFRPVTAVPKITAPVLYQIAQHDGMPSAGQVDKAIPRTPRAEIKRYPMDQFGPFSPDHQPAVATDATDFLRTHLTP
jgi:pimeloyl-ACP methyl ester carboxylesterase